MLTSKRTLAAFISLALAFGGGLSFSTISYAQEEAEDEAEDLLEEVLVTGSRIARVGAEMPTPTTVLSSEDIKISGLINVADIINELPALGWGVNGGVGDSQSGVTGLNLLNLRGLGTNRTLVLINGRRQVASVAGTAQVDINTIPAAMVERVEVITGGASAVYGADAVSGVVNLILKENFVGTQVDLTAGGYTEGDGKTGTITITSGLNFNDDKGNVWISGTFDHSDKVEGVDRDWISNQHRLWNDPDNPGYIKLFNNFRYAILPPNGLLSGPGGLLSFTDDGQLIPYDWGDPIDGNTAEGGEGLNLANSYQLQPETERTMISTGLSYELSDTTLFKINANFAEIDGKAHGQMDSSSSFPVLYADNAYLPAELTDILNDYGVPAFQYYRSNEDLGYQDFSRDSRTYNLSMGLEGKVNDNFTYEAFVSYGKTNSKNKNTNLTHNANFYAAVDAVDDGNGNVVCRSEAARAAGCTPLNVIGFNQMSDESRDYVTSTIRSESDITLASAGVVVTGDVYETEAGPISVAFGAEWREETSDIDGSDNAKDGSTYASNFLPMKGDFTVAEVFGEILIPVLSDVAFAKSLNVEAAYRYSDYSTIGGTSTWKLGADWAPVEGIRFRGTLATASRAPNIVELFSAQTVSSQFVSDPCDINNRAAGPTPAQREANCLALGLPADFVSNASSRSINVTNRGNENLDEETAETLTLGVVFTPSFIPGFTLSIDAWDIEIEDAIAPLGATRILDGCVDFDGSPALCALIERDSTGDLVNINTGTVNVSTLKTKGIDYEALYFMNAGSGELTFRLIGTYLREFTALLSDNDINGIQDQRDLAGAPINRGTFDVNYRYNDFGVNWSLSYVGKSRVSTTPEFVDPSYHESRLYHHLNINYQATDDLDFSLGVRNIFDEEPPLTVAAAAVYYDPVGRFVYGSVSYRF
jgi:iron complex outermembrane receptor protein